MYGTSVDAYSQPIAPIVDEEAKFAIKKEMDYDTMVTVGSRSRILCDSDVDNDTVCTVGLQRKGEEKPYARKSEGGCSDRYSYRESQSEHNIRSGKRDTLHWLVRMKKDDFLEERY